MSDANKSKSVNSSKNKEEQCVCVYCGSKDVIMLSHDEFMCLDCGEILNDDEIIFQD